MMTVTATRKARLGAITMKPSELPATDTIIEYSRGTFTE